MEGEEFEKLLALCNSGDVETRVSGITKLHAAFESGIEIIDKEVVLGTLKSCLRTSNQHLCNATLAAIPPLLPLLVSPNLTHSSPLRPPSRSSSTSSHNPASSPVDSYTLRQVIHAFLPAGGVIDRLGDSRDKARDKAQEILLILGGIAFRSSSASLVVSKSKDGSKPPETPLTLFERHFREVGLGSKVWRVREQSLTTLVHLRRAQNSFPIRPYLPLLVAALEDSDARVRECARESVVELYNGPGVTDTARADLKATMAKKNVRKGIVEGILSKLVYGSGAAAGLAIVPIEGSENGDLSERPKEYIPPSLALQAKQPTVEANTGPNVPARPGNSTTGHDAPRPPSRAATGPSSDAAGTSIADLRPIYITSNRDLENEFASMVKPFEQGKETEHNWSAREQSILRVRGMLKGDVHLRYMDAFLACLKDNFIQSSLKTLASLRTTVAVNTCFLYTELAVALGPALDQFCDTLLTNLLRMAGFTKKIAAQQSQNTVTNIITHCSAQPRIVLPRLSLTLQEKTVQARAFVVGHIKTFLEAHGQRSKHFIESAGGLELLEKAFRHLLADQNPAVRESARVCFWVFESIWRDRGHAILESLDNNARKQLEKACPDPAAARAIATVKSPLPKRSSVAAAIAASRAKAKAIAAAPPTLYHQATSASHASRAISPPLRQGAAQLPSSRTPAIQRSTSSSTSPPTSPRARIVSNPMSRTMSSNTVRVKTRSPPSSMKGTSPPTSPIAFSTPSKRSPLAATRSASSSSLRAALQIPLPASPPQSPITQAPQNDVPPIAPPAPRPSVLIPVLDGDQDLLMAAAIPIPEDTESDLEDQANQLSFSAVFEARAPPTPRSTSQARSPSPKSSRDDPSSVANGAQSLESIAPGPQPIVEDAMRARAEQAESAAERLLELVDSEEEAAHHSPIPTSLLVGNSSQSPKGKHKLTPSPASRREAPAPATPVNRNNAILKQAAMFKNSPRPNGKSSSLLDVLMGQKHETGWWVKRMNFIKRTPRKVAHRADWLKELDTCISALETGEAGVQALQNLALLCIEKPVPEQPTNSLDSSMESAHALPLMSPESELWTKNKLFTRMFSALLTFLSPSLEEDVLEYGLIVLWEILHHQAPLIEGKEAQVFSFLLSIRYCNKTNVLEATNTIRDDLAARIEPVYGLVTLHASLRDFRIEPPPPAAAAAASKPDEVKAATYAFGLCALGKFILRLPAEVVEDELPRMRETLTSALNDRSSLVVRESAAAAIIAAQLVLQDETHLFALLDGLADDKKNLLTYLFDKHAVRGIGGGGWASPAAKSGMERLAKEMGRLDARTSTPPRLPLMKVSGL